MSVGARAAAKMMALYDARKSASLADADDVHITLAVKNVDQNLVADLGRAVSVRIALAGFRLFSSLGSCCRRTFECNFAHELYRRQVVLAEMSLHRLGNVLALHELNQADLCGLVSVFSGPLDLRDHAWTSLQHRYRMNIAFIVEDLRHADLLSYNSVNHFSLLSSSL